MNDLPTIEKWMDELLAIAPENERPVIELVAGGIRVMYRCVSYTLGWIEVRQANCNILLLAYQNLANPWTEGGTGWRDDWK